MAVYISLIYTMSNANKSAVSKSNAVKTIALTDLNVDNMMFEAAKELKGPNTKPSKQHSIWVNFNTGTKDAPVPTKLRFRTEEQKVTSGIPRIDDDNVKTDDDREYVRITEEKSDKNSVDMFDVLRTMDKFIENKKNYILGLVGIDAKDIQKYEYTHLSREPEKEYKGEKKMRAKAKLVVSKILDKKTNKFTKEMRTTVFSDDESGKPVNRECKTVTDIEKYYRWQCSAKYILEFSRIWITKSGPKKFGLQIMLPQIYITKPNTGGTKADFSKFAFGGGDDEVVEVTKQVAKVKVVENEDETPTKSAKSAKSAKEVPKDEDDDDDDNGDASDKEDSPKPAAKNAKKGKK